MKNLLSVLLAALLYIMATPVSQAQAGLVFREKIISLSDLDPSFAPGDTIKVAFVFENKGAKPVTVLGVDSSCTCTVPVYTRHPVAPGQRGEVILVTTYKQLKTSESVYAVVMTDSEQLYHKIKLKWD